jgi:predicted ArsR family transcriptional regulator
MSGVCQTVAHVIPGVVDGRMARRSRRDDILRLCKIAQRYTDLKETLRLTDRGLTKHLKVLQKGGLLQKRQVEPGLHLYELTPAGRTVFAATEKKGSVRPKLESLVFLENVIEHHLELEGKDGEKLLEEIRDAIRRYVVKHSKKPILITLEYAPPP